MEKQKQPGNQDGAVQGEGDYAADRRYRERTDEFLKKNDVEEAAQRAAPKSKAEAEQMRQAEEKGRARADGQPKETRGMAKPTP
jgi:hypothetical protein